jgi:hypothetical protein
MRIALKILVLAGFIALCSSCSKQSQATEYDICRAHSAKAEGDFCSADITAAEKGLLAYRQWLLNSAAAGTPYPGELSLTDTRLFQIYETLGNTSRADSYFQEAAQANEEHRRKTQQPPELLTKETVRTRLEHQQVGEHIGWKTNRTPLQ